MAEDHRISFLVMGLGSIGKRHVRNLAHLGISDITVLRRSDTLAPDEALPPFAIATDLQRALARKPAAVIIASPTSLHMEQALAAAEAGCHILLEKPISHTFENVDTLQRIVQRNGVIVQVGFQFRFHPVLRQIKKLLEEGIIGRLVSAHAHWGEYLPSWHPWEDYRQGYSARQELGGGAVLTLSHPFDYLRWMCGEVQSVYATTGKLSHLDIDTEDVAMVNLGFASGAIGSVYLDYLEQPPRHDLSLIGEKGKIIWDNASGAARVFSSANIEMKQLNPDSTFERNTMFLQELSHFIDCIQHNRQTLCTLSDGVRALQIALAVKMSSSQNSAVQIN